MVVVRTVFVSSFFFSILFRNLRVIDTHRCEQLSALDGVVHHRLVRLLLLPLDRKQGVFADLGGHVARIGDCRCRARGRQDILLRLFRHRLLGVVILEELVDSPLAEQVGFVLSRVAGLAVGRAAVHPFDTVDLALAASGFERFLNLLFAPLFFDFLQALLQLLALGDRFGFGLLRGGNIPRSLGMPTLFHVQVSGTHLGGVVAADAAAKECWCCGRLKRSGDKM